MDKLAKLDSSSIQELQMISDNVRKYVDTENDATLQIALQKINQRPGLLRTLFPGKFEKLQSQLTLEKMQSIYEAKEKMFILYTGIQLEIARQQGDALIAATGMHLREQLTQFAASKIDSMSITLERSRQSFVERLKMQLVNMENYRDFPELVEPYHQSLKDEINIYFSTIKELLDGFRSALNRKVIELDS